MKSRNTNEIQTTGDQPVAIRSAGPPRQRVLCLAIAALAGLASTSALADDLIPTTSLRGDGKTVATFSTVGTGTWTIPAWISNVEVLIVGGGGGGGRKGGGGGGGGFYHTTSYTPAGGSVEITVGAGGLGDPGNNTRTAGGQSVFDSLIAYGGGIGDPSGTTQGGHSGANNQGDAGFAGGATNGAGGYGAGAGGGAGAAGLGWVNLTGGNGKQSAITGANSYYGGGGGGWYDGGNNAGGLGGGGHGSRTGGAGDNGVDGLGGGGGDARDSGFGGNGGSGVVIVAYDSGVTMRTVTFDSNGGSSVSSQIVPDGNTATQPTAPTQPGYTFVEWCSDIALTTPFNFSTPITADTTLYAKWLTNWTVTFESNSGSAVDAQSVTPGATATLPTPPTQPGHTFVEWCSDIALTTPFNFSTPITADTTLYAKWTISSYTLTYNPGANGSINGPSPQTVTYGDSGTQVEAVPNEGYQFAKWNDNSTANPRTDSNVSADITVTAIFELIPPPITPTSTATRSDGYTVATFSTVGAGTWTVPDGVTSMEVLVVGGGGAGSRGGAFGLNPNPGGGSPGGGAGGLYYTATYPVTGGSTVNLTVGAGAPVTAVTGDGVSGSQSAFGPIIAYGGQGAQYLANQGGNQGGYSTDGGSHSTAGYLGGTGSGATGGAGAGENGQNGGFRPSYGGSGVSNSITDTSIGYAGGGSAGYGGTGLGHGALYGGGEGSGPENTPGTSGVNGLGGGGGGGRGANAGGGGSGTVIVAYLAGGSTPYQTWAATFPGFTDSDPTHDPDRDGLSNQQEFAFGLDPTSGTSVNPITAPLDQSSHKFSYTRYAASGLRYTVWTSANLQGWAKVLPADMTESVGTPNGAGVATVEVTLTAPSAGAQLFVRVQAE
ncbi:MAG: InlB B-repeat-containing protein [Verrucomicrobia bacterium]|nr:InlB B-repeat-containing protein [Verrucomicrobiota bacterium]